MCDAGLQVKKTPQDVAFRDDHQDHHNYVVDGHPREHWLPEDRRGAAQTGADGMKASVACTVFCSCLFLTRFYSLCFFSCFLFLSCA
jgi:hypothetical protein